MTPIRPATLGERFDAVVAQFADAPALRTGDDTWSYRELGDAVDRAAAHLRACGVERGSRVVLSAGNSVGFAAAVFALARLGAASVMVSTSWREREVRHAIDLTGPTHVVHDGSGAVRIDELFGDLTAVTMEAVLAATGTDPDARADVDPDDLAVVFFSSGTTGLPKAARHSHRSLGAAIGHWGETLGMTGADRLQIATPPFHILGLLNLLVVVANGASVRLHPRFDLDAVLESIGRDGITIEMAVAPIALAMAKHPDLERFDLSSLRYIMWGATPVTAEIAEVVTRRTGVRFLPAYGATELPVIAVNPVDRPDEWRLDSVGLPPSGVELRVVDPETGAVAGPGEPGEIQGRSESVMLGYLPAEANRDAFDDGWYRTGDVGTIDAGGWVTITDRLKEMIKVNGFQVAPAEVEGLLVAHPDVSDCAVFGVPDADTGEAVIAAVELRPGATVTAEELRTSVSEELASYKRIADLVVVEQIPRLPSGKVLRRDLRASYEA